jgi:cytochrome c5
MLFIRAAALVLLAFVGVVATAHAAAGVEADLQVGSAATPAADGKDILTRKCFQCHQASMWSSVRGDRKAWESVLYRMVGRGALWTEAEVDAMADFLAQTRGPK